MDVKEKLIELVGKATEYSFDTCIYHENCEDCPGKKYGRQCRDFLEIDHLIANGVTVQEWIPVTERLPEDDLPKGSKVKQIKVLVAYKTSGRWVTRTQIRVKGYWYDAPDKWSWVKTSDPITHWMPLPQPPKGE